MNGERLVDDEVAVRLDVRAVGRRLVQVEVELLGDAVADPDAGIDGLGREQVVVRAERAPRVVLAGEDELVRVWPEDRRQVGPCVRVPGEVRRRVKVAGVDGRR